MTGFSTNLREIVYGGIDGIITTFAVVSGFSGMSLTTESAVSLSAAVVLLFGFANLFADGVSMGLGSFLSLRSENKLFVLAEKKKREELRKNESFEARKTADILEAHGFSKDDADTVTDIFRKNKGYWLNFMIREKINILPAENSGMVKKSVSIFCAFILFGMVPILPFLFVTVPSQAFYVSVMSVIIALTVLGIVRGAVTKENIVYAIAEVLFIGLVAGSIAFFIGSLFEGAV